MIHLENIWFYSILVNGPAVSLGPGGSGPPGGIVWVRLLLCSGGGRTEPPSGSILGSSATFLWVSPDSAACGQPASVFHRRLHWSRWDQEAGTCMVTGPWQESQQNHTQLLLTFQAAEEVCWCDWEVKTVWSNTVSWFLTFALRQFPSDKPDQGINVWFSPIPAN